jgi:hypothetical protein
VRNYRNVVQAWFEGVYPHTPDVLSPAAANCLAPPPPADGDFVPDEMPKGAVFLSYAIEDKTIAQGICDALHARGVNVWFDRHRLAPGESFRQQIRRHLQACSFFIPLISENTNAREGGYFRNEWRWAADLADETPDGVAFILPVVIDGSDPAKSAVPDRFRNLQWAGLPDGKVTSDFGEKIVQLLRECRKRQGA